MAGTTDPARTQDPAPLDLFDLRGRVAVVTGGANGIGLAIARGLARQGASVALGDLDGDKAEAAAMGIHDAGGTALAVVTDVTDGAQVQALMDTAVARLGRLDILVNNAGRGGQAPPESMPEAHWHSVLDTNLKSVWLCSRAAYPALRRSGAGRIVNVASVLAIYAIGGASAYGASKGGVMQLTKALATAWATDGIGVNAILPHWTDTDLTAHIRRDRPEFYARITTRTPAGRWGRPEDLVGAALFLASPAAAFVTGQGIVVDGGYTSLG